MRIEQFVMAYGAEQDRLRAMLPEEYVSLRPVLRIKAEIRGGEEGYLELNTPVERGGIRGWLNIASWRQVPFAQREGKTVFETAFLRIAFRKTGIHGGCPAEKDNGGCFLPGGELRPPETIAERREFCDCRFEWRFTDRDAHGVSLGKTLPALPTPPRVAYPRRPLTVENAAAIACDQVLGAYAVRFEC